MNRNIQYLSNEQYNQIISIVKDDPNIIDPGKMFKSNKILSYMTFTIKEIYDFLTKKTSDGVLILYLRKQNYNLNKMKQKLNFLSNLLNKVIVT